MLFAFAGSALLNSTPTTSTPSRSKITLAAAHRFSSTSTPGRMRSASTLPPRPAFSAMNSAESAPNAYPPMGWMNVTGQSVVDLSQHVFANLGWDEVRLTAPVFEGDTIYSESTILSLRDSDSRPDVGIVGARTVGFNQDGVTVIRFSRTLMVYRRGCGPTPVAGPSMEWVS